MEANVLKSLTISEETTGTVGNSGIEEYLGASAEVTQPCPAANEALSIELVLRKILLHLDVDTLLKTSLVNKLWCSLSRSVLRTSKRCLARISGLNPSEELFQLNRTISESDDLPYSGLAFKSCVLEPNQVVSISFGHDAQAAQLPLLSMEDVARLYPALLEKLTYRHLDFNWPNYPHLPVSCPGFSILMKILHEKRAELTELTLFAPTHCFPSLKQYLQIGENHWLPQLKVLEMGHGEGGVRRKFEIIQAAPQLEKYFGYINAAELDYFVSNDKVAVVQELCIDEYYFDDMNLTEEGVRSHPIVKFISCNPKLTKLSYSTDDYTWGWGTDNYHIQRIVQDIFRHMLEAVSSSLEQLAVDTADLLLLPTKPSKPMKALKKLALWVVGARRQGPEDPGYELPKMEWFDWSNWTPALDSIEIIYYSYRSYLTDKTRLKIQQQHRGVFACLSCTKLCITTSDYNLDYSSFRSLIALFPNIKQVSARLSKVSHLEKVLSFFLTSWPGLESIHIFCDSSASAVPNLDAVFCGIAEEQALKYRAETPEFLRTVELPPEAPSILTLKRLQSFKMTFGRGGSGSGLSSLRPRILTHVTAVLAFGRMPGLEVEIRIPSSGSSCKSDTSGSDMDPLKPYLKVLNQDQINYFNYDY